MSKAQGETRKCLSMWIHCNKCFENHTDRLRIIYVLSCFDLACEKCITIVNKREIKCPICQNIVKGFQIDNNLTANLKELFHPHPWSLGFPKAFSVMKFQNKQRDHFLMGCRKLTEYNKSLIRERDRVKSDCKEIYNRVEKKKNEKAKLAGALKKFKEITMAKKYANRGRGGMQRMNERNNRWIPSTCHVLSRSRNEDTFDFPPDTSISKSFYL